MPITTKLGSKVTYCEGFPLIKLHDRLITLSCENMWQFYISTTTMPEATKLSSVMTQGRSLKSHDHLSKWSGKVTWQIKYLISALAEKLLAPKLRKWWLTVRDSHSKTHDSLTTWPTYNIEQNIWRLFHILAQFFFTSSETELDYYHQKVIVKLPHELPDDLRLRILGN